MKRYLIIFTCFILSNASYSQYNMSNLTVYDCEGTLKDSESNALNPSWYSHDENFNFTICPTNALQITITFNSFSTEPVNDYLTIYDGPNNTYPILGGPYSGTNLPPQISSTGCITIEFISDQNIADEGFELEWETDVSIPTAPIINLPISPTCSTSVFNIELDKTRIKKIKIAYGGMSEIPKRAKNTEKILNNSNFSEKIFNKAIKKLEKDYKPIDDMRASKSYRMEIAKNLLMKCFLEVKSKKILRIN